MRLVAFDTAGPVVGVALRADGRTFVRTARELRATDALLMPWVLELLDEAGLVMGDLDGVAAAAGPGAFTGLRVGLATGAGLALALGVPLWTGSSLASRARRAGAERVLALLDARKGRVYAQFEEGGAVAAGPADVPPEVAVGWAGGFSFVATGEGALVYRTVVEAAGGVIAAEPDDPAVDTLAELAEAGLRRGEGRPATQVDPVYLRAPDAKPPRTGV